MMFRSFFGKILVQLVLAIVFFSSISVQALPNLSSEISQPVDINSKEIFFVYFRYGNPTATTVIPNIISTLDLSGDGVIIVSDQLFDLYYPTNNNQSIPQIPVCDNSYTGFDYQISSSLLKNEKNLIYGPQSASVLLEPSGAEVSNLPPRATGCLRVGLRVSAEAKVGDKVILNFDPDSKQSAQDLSPGKQSITLVVGENQLCSQEQELVLGKCLKKCIEGELRNKEGVCLSMVNICQLGKEIFDGKCVPACQFGENRASGGSCLPIAGGLLTFLGQIWTIPLILALIISVWFAAKPVYKRIKRLIRK